jgi:hypothetical protein
MQKIIVHSSDPISGSFDISTFRGGLSPIVQQIKDNLEAKQKKQKSPGQNLKDSIFQYEVSMQQANTNLFDHNFSQSITSNENPK